jgi:hypothetical protein
MKPIAAPIIGGMITSTIHVLVITPVVFYIMKPRALRLMPESRRSPQRTVRRASIANPCNDLQAGTGGARSARGMANARRSSRWKSVPLLMIVSLSVPPALAATPAADPTHACCTKVSPHHTELNAPACCRIPNAIPGVPAAWLPKMAIHTRLAIAAIPSGTPWTADARQPLVPVPPAPDIGYALDSLNTVLRR